MSILTQFELNSSPELFPAAVTDFLFARDDWPTLLANVLSSMSSGQLMSFAEASPEPQDVQPRSLCIASTSATTVVINWFDTGEYARLAKLGRQTPHRHQFDFGARVLAGGYVQWLFENDGDIVRPQLRFGKQMKCGTGDGYFLPHFTFHHVFAPDLDTITLMIRSPIRTPVERPTSSVKLGQLLADRELLVRKLSILPDLPRKTPGDTRLRAN